MTTKTGHRPFIGHASHWENNTSPATAAPALLENPAGKRVPGVRIHNAAGSWMILTEVNAVQLATDVLTVIEARRANHKEA
jgi:hypothetical protein